MRIRVVVWFALLFASASNGWTQSVTLSGTVREHESKEAIPGASLGLIGTSRGAKANRDGHYRLLLDAGKDYYIRITAIGYKPDTIEVALVHDESRDLELAVSPLGGATITISAEDSRKEARRIMHKVIDMKDAWQSQIHDYQFHVYSRGDLRVKSDTSSQVLAVLESVANGYWKRGLGYAERITARKETADIPADVNRIALFDVENFYNDRLQIEEYSIVSPVAHDAFDRYDYDLLGEGELNGSPVYKISVEPRNALFPAFSGTLWIDKADYTIAYLELSPNDAVQLGPVKNVAFEQTFSFVDNKFWMPSDMSFSCAIKFELPIVPNFYLSQSATLDNYVVNGGVADSLFASDRHTVAASADSVDSLHWVAMRTIPLARDEDTAYRLFDSLAVAFDSLRNHPSAPSLTPMGLLFGLVSTDLYQYNRVEGSRFELGHSWDFFETLPLTVSTSVGYGIGDAHWKYSAGFEQALTTRPSDGLTINIPITGDLHFTSFKSPPDVSSSISGNIYDEYVSRSDAYDPIVNTLTALLLHNDYPDYFHAHGFEIEYKLTPDKHFTGSLAFKNEVEQSLSNVTDFSLLLTRNNFRINPPIEDGRLHELAANVREKFDLGFWKSTTSARLNYSMPAIGSQFSYMTAGVKLSLEGKLGGWGKAWLSGSYESLLNGALPSQSLFFFDARDAVIAPRSVFRTMSPFEFQGDRAWSVMFEQNFYDLPTRALGITMPMDIHWFGFANVAGVTLSDSSMHQLAMPIQTLGNKPFAEAGFGIGNIWNVIRFDAAWRLTHRLQHNFFVTGTLVLSF